MPRADYPRDYPASFIYGLSAGYFVALMVEGIVSARKLASTYPKAQA